MQTLQQTYNPSYVPYQKKRQGILTNFFAWCEEQEKYRFGWLAAIIAVHGCVLTPVTVMTVVLGGNSIVFWAMAIGAMGMSLISNLAAMPTKVTIPVFFFSIVIDIVIIGISLFNYFSL